VDSGCVVGVYQGAVGNPVKLHSQQPDCIVEACLLFKQEEAMKQRCQVDEVPQWAFQPMLLAGAGN